MTPTPDERRLTWIEPGMTRVVEDGRVVGVEIDLLRSDAYQGNGVEIQRGRPCVVLSAAAIRRLYRQLPPDER